MTQRETWNPVDTQTSLRCIKVFYLPTDAQLNCLKNNFKIYIKIDINLLAPEVYI
jgi:hypothetical protein